MYMIIFDLILFKSFKLKTAFLNARELERNAYFSGKIEEEKKRRKLTRKKIKDAY